MPRSNSVTANTIIFSICLIFLGCEPLAMSWDKTEDATLYQASRTIDPPTAVDTLLVMTWNIRFGASRISWFGDGCGERVLLTENEVIDALENLARKITEIDPIRGIARVRRIGGKSLEMAIRTSVPTANYEGEAEEGADSTDQ